MPKVGVRDLQRDASGVIARVMRTGRPTIVTKHNEPVAAVVAIDAGDLEDFVLANAPEFVRAMRSADRALVEGRTASADAVFAEIEAEPMPRPTRESEPPRLSEREREVLRYVAEGFAMSDIAERLDVTPQTVKRTLTRTLVKLGAGERAMAAHN
jgi:prevent-host-death family protein